MAKRRARRHRHAARLAWLTLGELLYARAPAQAQGLSRAPPAQVPRLDLDRTTIAALLALDTTPMAPPAPPSPAPPAAPSPPSLVSRGRVDIAAPLLVNDRLLGDIDVAVDARGAGDIDAARLVTLLTKILDAPLLAALRARIAGRAMVPLAEASVAPMTLMYDPATLEVRITLPVARMQSQQLNFRGFELPDPARFTPQARLAGGVAIGVAQRFDESGPTQGRAPLLLSLDAFTTVGKFPGFTLRGGGLLTENAAGGFAFERAQTQLRHDSFDDAVHYVLGEFTPAVTGFQGAAPALGAGIARDYAGIRPFENIRPSGRGSVTLDRPSTVIVEVNGVETRRLQLAPGRYDLTDLSSVSGVNDVRLFVQDDLGRREVASASFFTATAMLAGGLTDFGAAIGKAQSAPTIYGGPVTLTGYVRHGFGGRFTLGAGGQYADGDWQIDAEGVVGTPLGLFRGQGSGSYVRGRSGYALSLDWLLNFQQGRSSWNFSLLSSYFSRAFASPFDRDGRINDEIWRVDGRADWRRDQIGLTLVAGLARTRSRSELESANLTLFYSWRSLTFTGTVGAEHIGRAPWSPRALFGVSIQLGTRSNASLRVDTDRRAVVADYSLFPIDQVDDLSGRLQVVRDDDRIGLAGEARYFGNRFIANVEQQLFYAQGTEPAVRQTTLRAATFIGFAGGSVAIGRPTPGNFAIYDRHASLNGARVVVRDESDYVVGRQDFLGPALVPFNRAFSPVNQTYDVDPLPPGYDLGEGRLSALPGAFSGYRVSVGSDYSRVAIGYLIVAGAPLANYAGTVDRVGDRAFEPRPFFTNANGRFAVDRLAPGDYRMIIDGTVVARFSVSPKSEGLVDVGKIAATAP